MAITTPAIPNNFTATAEIKIKQGVAGSELRYNDSTTAEAGTNINGLTTNWQTLMVTISNDNDTFTRTIYLGDTQLAQDYTSTFPVLWCTTKDNAGQSIYFDDLTIKTTENEQPEQPDEIKLSYDNGKAVITGMTEVEDGTKLIEAVYTDDILTGIKLHDVTDAAQPIKLEYSPADGTLRLMLWAGMKPLLPAIIAEN